MIYLYGIEISLNSKRSPVLQAFQCGMYRKHGADAIYLQWCASDVIGCGENGYRCAVEMQFGVQLG